MRSCHRRRSSPQVKGKTNCSLPQCGQRTASVPNTWTYLSDPTLINLRHEHSNKNINRQPLPGRLGAADRFPPVIPEQMERESDDDVKQRRSE
ncbi:hypothetical protein E2C01_067269 [Portunus trituberculatus]|uniref:Uncharacterized protein n=1 Tax=Portunus trituberculatus TaxID=210409 RepID=A0A5B7HT64_PORTR|nr:hypothetical protein [Portunus trituberculatus]